MKKVVIISDITRPWMLKINIAIQREIKKKYADKKIEIITIDAEGEFNIINEHGESSFLGSNISNIKRTFLDCESNEYIFLSFNSKSRSYQILRLLAILASAKIIHHYHGINQRNYVFSWKNGWKKKATKKLDTVTQTFKRIRQKLLQVKLSIQHTNKPLASIKELFIHRTEDILYFDDLGAENCKFHGICLSDLIFLNNEISTVSASNQYNGSHVEKIVFVSSGAFYNFKEHSKTTEKQITYINTAYNLAKKMKLNFELVLKESEEKNFKQLSRQIKPSEYTVGLSYSPDCFYIVPDYSTTVLECIKLDKPFCYYSLFETSSQIRNMLRDLPVEPIETLKKLTNAQLHEYIGQLKTSLKDIQAWIKSNENSAVKRFASYLQEQCFVLNHKSEKEN